MNSKLYLIPNTLGTSDIHSILPEGVISIIHSLDHFIVENIRTARRFLIKTGYPGAIDSIRFFELDKHSGSEDMYHFLDPCRKGINMGIISEAGVPAVADPGSSVVAAAHKDGIQVVPLTGPSSILLALMASGLNGQSFSFLGYLPVHSGKLASAIRDLETRSLKETQTQIFIETPYRNMRLFNELVRTCKPGTKLSIAVDLTTPEEKIFSKNIMEWRNLAPDLDKKPAVFLLQA